MSISPAMVAVWACVVFLLATFLSLAALRYARWRQLLDMPGRRRSHAAPTPRGGGVAIVATLLLVMPFLSWADMRMPATFALALMAVAGIGWMDDHRPLSARLRLAVHLLAAIAIVTVLLLTAHDTALPGWAWVPVGLLVMFWLAGCINAWNFMDGSNGLVTSQCLWLGLMLAFVFFRMADAGNTAAWPWAGMALALAAACAGFLPFNFPRAAIFLGDVGSGALGLICGVLLLSAFWLEPANFWWLLLLPSALLVDAGMTLLWRVVSGRRWYTAHREHLYQWLIRGGRSHAQVAMLYLGWNLVVVLPVCIAIMRWPEAAMWLTLSALMLAAMLWWLGKGRVRKRVREQGSCR